MQRTVLLVRIACASAARLRLSGNGQGRNFVRAILFVLLTSATACGSADDAQQDGTDQPMVSYPHPVTPPTPKSASQVLPDAYPTPHLVARIPSSYRGRWTTVAARCGPADERLLVGTNNVRQGRSRRTVANAVALSPTKLHLALRPADAGGGQWAMTLLHEGKTLVVERSHPPRTRRFQRCPA